MRALSPLKDIDLKGIEKGRVYTYYSIRDTPALRAFLQGSIVSVYRAAVYCVDLSCRQIQRRAHSINNLALIG